MWTRKAAFTFTGGIALILIGMMISNHQMMILGFAFVAFIVVNSWISGHGDVEVLLQNHCCVIRHREISHCRTGRHHS